MAYQGYGLGLDLDSLRSITEFATNGLRPDLTFYLDIPVEIGLQRRFGAVDSTGFGLPETQFALFNKWDRLDRKEVEYHRRVQEGYEELMRAEPERWHRVDANRPLEEVQADIRRKVRSLLEDWS